MNNEVNDIIDDIYQSIQLIKTSSDDGEEDKDQYTGLENQSTSDLISQIKTASPVSDDPAMKDKDVSLGANEKKVKLPKSDPAMKPGDVSYGTGERKVKKSGTSDDKDLKKSDSEIKKKLTPEIATNGKVASAFYKIRESIGEKNFDKEAGAIGTGALALGSLGIGAGAGYLGGRAHEKKLDTTDDSQIARQGIQYGYRLGSTAMAERIKARMQQDAQGGSK